MHVATNADNSNPLRNRLRNASIGDAADITRLLRTAKYRHLHLDWDLPTSWLGDAGFVVIEKDTRTHSSQQLNFIRSTPELVACVAITADPPPAAWMRIAAVDNEIEPDKAVYAMVDKAAESLRENDVNIIGWLAMEEWFDFDYKAIGFEHSNDIVTLRKENLDSWGQTGTKGVVIRTVSVVDFEILADIERRAFKPLWRYSVNTLISAYRYAISFTVAEIDGLIVGYQFSNKSDKSVHLTRMTVDPDYQARGIGTSLVISALTECQGHGAASVTLNTQADNEPSLRLYRKFGFQPTELVTTLWTMAI